MTPSLQIMVGDALEKLRELPGESVHCCVTSPPYWGLRDYGTAAWKGGEDGCIHEGDQRYYTEQTAATCSSDAFSEPGQANIERLKEGRWRNNGTCVKCGAVKQDSQLGLEKTPEAYVSKMVEVFREVRHVLRKDGTLWLNLGDSYAGGSGGRGDSGRQFHANGDGGPASAKHDGARIPRNTDTLKPKDLCGIPWRVAFALQADGWYLRQDIIWAKPNPMPESVTDRCTKSHEYLFLLTRSPRYFYDAEAIKESSTTFERQDYVGGTKRHFVGNGHSGLDLYSASGETSASRNKRSVWTVATAPYPKAHFATYPPDLIKPCILAGTSAKGCCAKCGAPWERIVEKETNTELRNLAGKNNDTYQRGRVTPRGSVFGDFHDLGTVSIKTLGWKPTCECYKFKSFGLREGEASPCTVLDPFAGSGTTGMVALELGRKAILIELNPKYAELIEQRCNVTPGLAMAV